MRGTHGVLYAGYPMIGSQNASLRSAKQHSLYLNCSSTNLCYGKFALSDMVLVLWMRVQV